jgi:hypothetical protein
MPNEQDGTLRAILVELVARGGGPTRVAALLREHGLPITKAAISNYTAGIRTPTNSMVAALLDIGKASPEEAAAAWVAAGVPAADLAGGGAT